MHCTLIENLVVNYYNYYTTTQHQRVEIFQSQGVMVCGIHDIVFPTFLAMNG
jgi:hypothetical protein